MEQSPSWEADRFSASEEIPSLYGNRKFIAALTVPATCHCRGQLWRNIYVNIHDRLYKNLNPDTLYC
jgi:hypothetical protein